MVLQCAVASYYVCLLYKPLEIWRWNIFQMLSAVTYVFPTADIHLQHAVTVFTVADADNTIPAVRWCAFTNLHGIVTLIS